MRMRCEIAASLLYSPDILFLDEPTIGLDAVSKIAVRQFIRKLNSEKRQLRYSTTQVHAGYRSINGENYPYRQGGTFYWIAIYRLEERNTTLKPQRSIIQALLPSIKSGWTVIKSQGGAI